jgi:hypothetical protein
MSNLFKLAKEKSSLLAELQSCFAEGGRKKDLSDFFIEGTEKIGSETENFKIVLKNSRAAKICIAFLGNKGFKVSGIELGRSQFPVILKINIVMNEVQHCTSVKWKVGKGCSIHSFLWFLESREKQIWGKRLNLW